jgi:signal transduction histidine kinase
MECSDANLKEYLQKMKSTTSVIQSQIEFTRIYQDLGSLEPQWIQLYTAIPHVSLPASLTLNTDLQGISVFSDPMLEKVFFNLLDNSIQHGQLVTEIRVSAHESDGNLTIVWEDNGVGIPEKEKDFIFDRGFGKNTGFGLFMIHEILSLTGISIRETGVPGSGARFEITVPKDGWRIA